MENLPAKQALYDLFAIASQLNKVLKVRPDLEILIKFILSKDFYFDEDTRYPSLKEVEAQTGLSTYQLRKQIKDLYEFTLEEDDPILSFEKGNIIFFISYLDQYYQFSLSQLSRLPRIGESFEIPFLKAKFGTYLFYVNNVTHTLEGNSQRIRIDLKGGRPNSYLKLRKDKAEVFREIPFKDLFKPDWYFEDKLLRGELKP
ncbi:MAG TPA: hypothetical protein VIM94_09740 [Salegentibacter sp.]|uniref:hypothetical protein n=1 Tax=Salegentibacter sp. TaxID=1903072 RepID=UPI002F956EDD